MTVQLALWKERDVFPDVNSVLAVIRVLHLDIRIYEN